VGEACGRPATFTLASGNDGPPRWRTVLDMIAATNARGGQVTAQVMPRPIGLIAGLELTVHPFVLCPSWAKIAALPLVEKLAAMPDPTLRAAFRSEQFGGGHSIKSLARNWERAVPLPRLYWRAVPAGRALRGAGHSRVGARFPCRDAGAHRRRARRARADHREAACCPRRGACVPVAGQLRARAFRVTAGQTRFSPAAPRTPHGRSSGTRRTPAAR